MSVRCDVCRAPMHRFGFARGLKPGDADEHEPSAIACVNGIIGEIEQAFVAGNPYEQDARWLNAKASLTMLADAFNQLVRYPPAEHPETEGREKR